MIPTASRASTFTLPLIAGGSWGWTFWIRNSSRTASPAVSRPARSDASTSATSPPMRTRYFPRGTMVVRRRSTDARFIIASVASIPLAIELVSSIAIAGPNVTVYNP